MNDYSKAGTFSIYDDNDPSYGTDALLGDIRPITLARKAKESTKTVANRRKS